MCFVFYILKPNITYEKLSYQSIVYDKTSLDSIKQYSLAYSNQDIVGKIIIDDTTINDLIVQGNDNSFYLNHNLFKEEDLNGSIFLDYRNSIYDKQINIYAHSNQDNTGLFADLKKYRDINFKSYIKIITNTYINVYKVVSVKIVNNDYEYMSLDINNSHINWFNEDTLYNTDDFLTINDNILVLQTCSYDHVGDLLVATSKLISREEI